MSLMTLMMGPVTRWLFFYLVPFVATAVLIFGLSSFAFWRVKSTIPNPADWKTCRIFRSWINAVTGVVFYEGKELTWRFDPKDLPRKTAFLFYDTDEHEALCIRRHRFFPPKFQMIQAGRIIGFLRLRSFLLNQYTLELPGGATWTFVMPLYTVHFRGASTAGESLRIWMGPSKRQWNILAAPGFDQVEVIAAIAFIHRRWYL